MSEAVEKQEMNLCKSVIRKKLMEYLINCIEELENDWIIRQIFYIPWILGN